MLCRNALGFAIGLTVASVAWAEPTIVPGFRPVPKMPGTGRTVSPSSPSFKGMKSATGNGPQLPPPLTGDRLELSGKAAPVGPPPLLAPPPPVIYQVTLDEGTVEDLVDYFKIVRPHLPAMAVPRMDSLVEQNLFDKINQALQAPPVQAAPSFGGTPRERLGGEVSRELRFLGLERDAQQMEAAARQRSERGNADGTKLQTLRFRGIVPPDLGDHLPHNSSFLASRALMSLMNNSELSSHLGYEVVKSAEEEEDDKKKKRQQAALNFPLGVPVYTYPPTTSASPFSCGDSAKLTYPATRQP
jgi:hypothetical protein